MRATLDDNGKVVGSEHRIASPSTIKRWAPPLYTKGIDFTSINSATPAAYAFESDRTTYSHHEAGVPVGFMRAPGANRKTFVTESFIDELAHAGGKDPLAFRLGLLTPSATRERAVLELVAQEAGWGHPKTAGASQGLALANWDGSVAALVAECTVDGHNVRVRRVVIAAN